MAKKPVVKEGVTPRVTANVPMTIQEQIAKEIANIQTKIAAPSGDRIEIKKNTTIITPDGSEGEELEIVILDFVTSNLYYDRPYNKDVITPPACFAIGPEPTLLIPSNDSPVRQADTCSSCPMNQFGSATTGAGKACKNARLLAVSPADWDGEEPPIWILSVPPASIKHFDSYVSNLAVRNKTIPIGVVTKLTLDSSSEYSSPRFEVVRPLDSNELSSYFQLRESASARLNTQPDVTGYEPPKQAGRIKR